MIKLDKYEQQLIFACKSWGEWAKKEDRLKAVKIVVGQYYGFELENLESYTVYYCLLNLYLKINEDRINKFFVSTLMEKIFIDRETGNYINEANIDNIINTFISNICQSY